jgi:hypothetical protein
MAKSTLKASVSDVIIGMDQLNEEKREINLIIGFLTPILQDIAYHEVNKANLLHGGDPLAIFSVNDGKGNILDFDAIRELGSRYGVLFSLTLVYSEERGESTIKDYPSKFAAEHIVKGDIAILHGLLQPLLDEVLSRTGSYDRDIQIFLEAAERAKK